MMAALSFITSMFGSSKTGIMFVIGAVAAIGWGMYYMTDKAYDALLVDSAKKIERAEQNTRTVEGVLKATNASLDQLRLDRLEDYKLKIQQDVERAQDRKELADLQNKLNSYRKRWANVANKKPELLARIINRATRKRVREIQAATCRANCNPDENSSNGS
ncbi:MAG: hypothetical protein JKY52_00305 [Flavobacteriales bacterium]|nr:hypothetical protein [Flavobacteriales bacterium]